MEFFSTEPDTPADSWIGIFLYSDDDLNYACLLFGGEANQPQKTLIGSMVEGGKPIGKTKDTSRPVLMSPFTSKSSKRTISSPVIIEKSEKEDWTLSGDKTWNHKFDVERVGIGFMNSWGGQTVTFLVDTLSIEGEGIEPLAIAPKGKLANYVGDTQTELMAPYSRIDSSVISMPLEREGNLLIY